MKKPLVSLIAGTIIVAVTACVENPVTGERDFGFVSTQQEIQIGQENYLATQQMQGGAYERDPELSRYVSEVGRKLAAVADRDLPYEFVVLNNSVPNAWALPGGKIAINRGLLVELDNEAELAAVLGHEIVHAAARHGAQTMERSMLLQLGVLAAGIAASDSEYGDLAVGAGLIGAQLVNAKYGRDAELESDYYGMEYMAAAGYDPSAAVSLQQTFVQLAEGREQGWLQGLFASHPPSQERVERNRAHAQALPDGGTLGQDEYLQRTAHIREIAPAYEAYDAGVQALRDGKPGVARDKARAALDIAPREAKFHGLLGQVALYENDHDAALEHFDKAVELDPRHFEFRIYRGLLLEDAGRLDEARADYDQANRLLPTAIAHEGLGDIAVQQGRRDDAIAHYRVAAQSDSEVGRRAAEKLARLMRE